jgi:cell division protein FtsQ
MWFRDSQFVAVETVTVEGAEGPEAEAVRAALSRAGAKMTTLNVDEGALATSVSGFPTVLSVNADADFPHGLTVQVSSRPPVLNAADGGAPVPVAADGTVLRGVEASDSPIPTVDVDELPAQGKLEGEPLDLAQVSGAAPEPLRSLIEKLSPEGKSGLVVELKGGIPVVFGDASQSEDKWAAVAAVLADPSVKTLTSLDVRVPERPAIGGAAPPEKGAEEPLE